MYTLGQKVRIVVAAVDKLTRTVDFVLAEEEEPSDEAEQNQEKQNADMPE